MKSFLEAGSIFFFFTVLNTERLVLLSLFENTNECLCEIQFTHFF